MDRIAVTKSADFRGRFECTECGFSCGAKIHIDGGGTGTIPVTEETVDRAVREAERIADRNMEQDSRDALKLVRCPKCGKRSRKALVELAVWTIGPSIFFAGLAYWMILIFVPIGFAVALASAGMLLLGFRTLMRAGSNVTLET